MWYKLQFKIMPWLDAVRDKHNGVIYEETWLEERKASAGHRMCEKPIIDPFQSPNEGCRTLKNLKDDFAEFGQWSVSQDTMASKLYFYMDQMGVSTEDMDERFDSLDAWFKFAVGESEEMNKLTYLNARLAVGDICEG